VAGTPFQASLLDTATSVEIGPVAAGLSRRPLAGGAWVDVRRRWVTGADSLFERLRAEVPWRAERRPMYDRTVDVPRLLSFYTADEPLPDAALDEARRALDQHYAAELGEPFTTVGLAFYRDGRDSVAWHGDRLGRGSTHDTMVAILVLGAPRTLLLRPRPGTPPAQASSRSAPGLPAAASLFTGGPSATASLPDVGASVVSPPGIDLSAGKASTDGQSGIGRPSEGSGPPEASSLSDASSPTGISSPSGAGGATGTIRFELGHGDLLVMGGSCQRTWEHAVPKTARAVGPRISVQFRPHNVR
jgi:alkylated DNA repair dioxygenase AlkB